MQIKTTLYKQSATGAVQQWAVFVEGNKVTVEFGQVDGKLRTKDTLCKGKNLGKSNATTDDEQAVSEAESKWEKQVKKGYAEDPVGEPPVLLPMKVESYFKGKMKDKVEFPCTISRKLNGVNGECRRLADGSFVQLSRGGEEYPKPPAAAVRELRDLMTILGVDSLNYEIYKHGTFLQDITGAVKAPHNHGDLWAELEYYVFDLPTVVGDWKARKEVLDAVDMSGFKYVRIVNSEDINSHEDIITLHADYVAQNYEGAIVRNYKGLYKYNTRTMDVLKVKDVESEEFQVKSWFLDKNNHPIYVCSSKGGDFKVKRKGTDEERTADVQNADNNVGKWLTVEFEMYSKDNRPLKGVGTAFRACDSTGNPLE